MTVRECYEAMGADYDSVINRLLKDERVKKFVSKVPGDPSYELLHKALENHDAAEAFRAAHTIKGICLNLSLTRLYQSSSVLAEYLRGKNSYNEEELTPLVSALDRDYLIMKETVAQLEG